MTRPELDGRKQPPPQGAQRPWGPPPSPVGWSGLGRQEACVRPLLRASGIPEGNPQSAPPATSPRSPSVTSFCKR